MQEVIALADSSVKGPAGVLATGLEIAGLLVIALGGVLATIRVAIGITRGRQNTYFEFRRDFARALIVGLEILVAADIVLTVVVDRTLEVSFVLGVLVLVRVVLGWTLEVDIEGFFPWNRWRIERETGKVDT